MRAYMISNVEYGKKTYFGNLSELQEAKMTPKFFERLQAPLSHEPVNVSEQIRVALWFPSLPPSL